MERVGRDGSGRRVLVPEADGHQPLAQRGGRLFYKEWFGSKVASLPVDASARPEVALEGKGAGFQVLDALGMLSIETESPDGARGLPTHSLVARDLGKFE